MCGDEEMMDYLLLMGHDIGVVFDLYDLYCRWCLLTLFGQINIKGGQDIKGHCIDWGVKDIKVKGDVVMENKHLHILSLFCWQNSIFFLSRCQFGHFALAFHSEYCSPPCLIRCQQSSRINLAPKYSRVK